MDSDLDPRGVGLTTVDGHDTDRPPTVGPPPTSPTVGPPPTSPTVGPPPTSPTVGPPQTNPMVGPPPTNQVSPSPEDSLAAVDEVLDEVELALSRLDQGTYGRCSSCGEVIDDASLVWVPTRQTCSACTPDGI